jgi:hypothetical protein
MCCYALYSEIRAVPLMQPTNIDVIHHMSLGFYCDVTLPESTVFF